jgi:hypothetical protein
MANRCCGWADSNLRRAYSGPASRTGPARRGRGKVRRRKTRRSTEQTRSDRCGRGICRSLKRDGLRLNQHRALSFCLSMIFSENRYTLFRIMR